MVYSQRYLDNRWHFKRAPISSDNLSILILWPFECRLPYRTLTHSPCVRLSLGTPLPPQPAFIHLFLSSLPLSNFTFTSPFSTISLLQPHFSFTRFSIDPQSDPEALFRITPDTGLITTAMELDRERDHWHNITVIATQRGQRSLSLSLELIH